MVCNLRELLRDFESQKVATDVGTQMHKKLSLVRVLSDCDKVDSELKKHIESCAGLSMFFTEKAQMEVPIAGELDGDFVSCRVDRFVVDDENKIVHILDYKTDVDRVTRRKKYEDQLEKYARLMRQIYPKYKIKKYILWLHDWTLEEI